MWNVTGWALAVWLKIGVLTAVLVGAAWLLWGTGSAWFWTVALTAVGTWCFLTRQLVRAWLFEASLRWWWSR